MASRTWQRGRERFRLEGLTDRSLLVAFSDVERVLKDGVHDPADAEGRLDDVGDNLLHCGGRGGEGQPELHHPPTLARAVPSGVKLTVQSLLEALHTHHVLGELEGLALRLDGELSKNKDTPVSSAENGSLVAPLSQRQRSPSLTQQLLLICNVTLVTHGQEVHGDLGILLVGLPHGSFVGLKLDNVNHFVQGSEGKAQRAESSKLLSWETRQIKDMGSFRSFSATRGTLVTRA